MQERRRSDTLPLFYVIKQFFAPKNRKNDQKNAKNRKKMKKNAKKFAYIKNLL